LDWRDLSQRSLNWKDLRLNRVISSLPQESHSLSQLLPNSSRYYQINGSVWRLVRKSVPEGRREEPSQVWVVEWVLEGFKSQDPSLG